MEDVIKAPKEKYRGRMRIGADMLLRLLEIPDSMVREATIKMSRTGLNVAVVDPAHVALVTMKVSSELFEEYSYENDEDSEYGINIEKLKKKLKNKFSKKAVVTMSFDKVPSVDQKGQPFMEHFLDLKIKNGNYSKNHRITQEDTAGINIPKIPSLSLPITIEIRSIGDMLMILDSIQKEKYDHINFITKYDNPLSISFGDEPKGKNHKNMVSFDGNASFAPVAKANPKWPTEQEWEFRSIFPIDYLYNIFKALTFTFGADTKAILMLGQDYPIEITCYNPVVQVTFLLAPRIESD